MNYERMGIYVTLAVMVGVLGVAGILSGEFNIDLGTGVGLPQINAGTNTNNPIQEDGFYDYCYRMGLDC